MASTAFPDYFEGLLAIILQVMGGMVLSLGFVYSGLVLGYVFLGIGANAFGGRLRDIRGKDASCFAREESAVFVDFCSGVKVVLNILSL